MPYKHAIIGLGGISFAHEEGVRRSPDFELYAVCDIKPDVLKKRGDQMQIPEERRFLDYKEMLDKLPELQSISICTPNNVHYPIALECVKRGLPYACEKPVSNGADEVQNLADKTHAAHVKNMVCFSYRFQSAARYARKIVESGELGEIYPVNGAYSQSWGMESFHAPLVWRFVKDITGSGALGDLGCHLIDLVRFVTGKEFVDVTAQTGTFIKERKLLEGEGMGKVDVDDYVNILGTMNDNSAVNLHVTRFGYSRGNYQFLEVYGSRGAIRYEQEEGMGCTLEVNIGNTPMERGHVWVKVPIPRYFECDQMQSFADILKGTGDGLPATIDDGAINQRIVDAVLESAEKGIRVTI